MNGIEILAAEEIAVAWKFNWYAFEVVFPIICFLAVAFGIMLSIESGDWTHLIASAVIGVIIGALVAYAAGDITGIPIKYTSQYKVTISDEVSMNEFNAKYKIIDQEGKIYTVRERTEET